MGKNPCIQCDVGNCQFHCGSENYCTLNTVKIGTHENNPKVPECVDCESFVRSIG
ncbi:MAG: DUF1540 domain-containing protein [Ruminococcus sp.]|nr:DUF1540 domain-containing protein [Ruminococcus sp.]